MQETDEQLTVDLVSEAGGVSVTKRYRFTRGSYLIEVSFLISNQSADRFQANVFGQIKRDVFDDPSAVGGFGRTYLGFVTTSEDDPYIRIDFDEVDDGTETFDTQGGWIGFSQHYFISAWIPNSNQTNRYTTRKNDVGQYFGEFTGSAIVVAPGDSAEYNMGFYAGPKDQYALAEISPNLDLTIDYGFLWFLAAPIYWLLRQIDSFINNYGFSIIALTLVVKALFYKLSETQYRSMAGMRRVMPKMESLKEAYGDDRMKLQQATMELYKKEKINPFWWMLTDAGSDAGFYCTLLGLAGKRGTPSRGFRIVAAGSVRAGSLLYPASADGGDHVPANKPQSNTGRPYTGQSHENHARHDGGVIPLVPGRSCTLLVNKRAAGHSSTVVHHQKTGCCPRRLKAARRTIPNSTLTLVAVRHPLPVNA